VGCARPASRVIPGEPAPEAGSVVPPVIRLLCDASGWDDLDRIGDVDEHERDVLAQALEERVDEARRDLDRGQLRGLADALHDGLTLELLDAGPAVHDGFVDIASLCVGLADDEQDLRERMCFWAEMLLEPELSDDVKSVADMSDEQLADALEAHRRYTSKPWYILETTKSASSRAHCRWTAPRLRPQRARRRRRSFAGTARRARAPDGSDHDRLELRVADVAGGRP